MRVAFITTSFPRFPTDYAGVFVYDLARALVQCGIEVRVLAPHTAGTPRCEQMAGVAVTRFPYFYPAGQQRLAYGAGIPTNLRRSRLAKMQILPFVFSFLAAVRHVAPDSDLIHAHWIEPGLLSLPWSRLLRRPLVLSVHRYNPPGRIGRHLYDTVLSRADFVLFNSHYTEARCRSEVAIRSGGVVPPGIDTSRFSPRRQLHEDRPEPGKPTVFALGSLLPVKGFIHLVEAIPLILQHTPCHFVIGGRGPERERLLERAEQLGVVEHLTLLGQVPTSTVPALMRQAALFVLPSVPDPSGDNEALGMVLVEALASGTACVASATGGICDVVEDGVHGYLVRPGDPVALADKVVTLLQNPTLREQMGRAGRERVEQIFDLNVVASRVIDVYETLLQS